MPLFPSQKRTRGGQPKAINRSLVHKALQDAFEIAGLNGKLATHSLRESSAQRLYEENGDIYLVQELLGHRNVSTTQEYIGINYASAPEAVESMALRSERDRNTILLGSTSTSDH